ncbi:hypothetical protein TrRE_jg834, partial [Triparma retinervis]
YRPRTRGVTYDEDDEGEALRVLFDVVNGKSDDDNSGSNPYGSPKKRTNNTRLSRTPNSLSGTPNSQRKRKERKVAGKARSYKSLSMLDFTRRNQYAEEREDMETEREFERVLPSFDRLGLWAELKGTKAASTKAEEFTTFNFPPITNPSSKHPSQIMALVHNIRRSKFFTYEHFYADIDKPFYDHSPLSSFMARYDLYEDTTLTREEWNVVKTRAIQTATCSGTPFNPRNPSRRLFSPKFVASQISSLETYRKTAREIQRDPCAHPEFPHAVRGLLPVGSTCTALHSYHNVIHRGIILADTSASPADPPAYVVQFERPSLGVSIVPDLAVSCHGPRTGRVREALDPFADLSSPCYSIGKVPYGTSYGPLLNHTRMQDAAFFEVEAVEAVTQNTAAA